jgi:hypothetical protein
MTVSKKILITTESREIFILRAGSKESLHGFCPGCGREVELLTLDQAVSISGTGAKELFWLVESGRIHAIETDTKHLLMCLASIADLDSNLI